MQESVDLLTGIWSSKSSIDPSLATSVLDALSKKPLPEERYLIRKGEASWVHVDTREALAAAASVIASAVSFVVAPGVAAGMGLVASITQAAATPLNKMLTPAGGLICDILAGLDPARSSLSRPLRELKAEFVNRAASCEVAVAETSFGDALRFLQDIRCVDVSDGIVTLKDRVKVYQPRPSQ